MLLLGMTNETGAAALPMAGSSCCYRAGWPLRMLAVIAAAAQLRPTPV